MTDPGSLGAFLLKGRPEELPPARKPVHLAIVGSTAWTADPATRAVRLIEEILDKYQPHMVISGGAVGVDRWAADAAQRRHIPVKEYLPKNPRWRPEGYEARNTLIAEACTHLVAIISPTSKTFGSGWTANKAESLGKPVERHRISIREP